MTWLFYAVLTMISWGLYGVFLHVGQIAMGDPIHGRYKAFLLVGVAYFLIAVLWPAGMMMAKGATWTFTTKGLGWSLFAGILGAIGAFGVILAFGAKGSPSVVMSIVFAGAPIINAISAMMIYPPAGGFSSLRWQFITGIFLAALGGFLVTLYKPPPSAPHNNLPVQASHQPKHE